MVIHLVRHGEVANPNHVVYGDLPGFNLSPRGVLQVHAAGGRLAIRPVTRILTSPLARARQTAVAIARHHGLPAQADDRLVETRQFPHWTGRRWDDIRTEQRDEYVGYLQDATTVPGGEEDITAVAGRASAAILDGLPETGELVVVGHQDTTQAARLHLTGRPLSALRVDPPAHASVITLERRGDEWHEVGCWEPQPIS